MKKYFIEFLGIFLITSSLYAMDLVSGFLIGQAKKVAAREFNRAANDLADRTVDYALGTNTARNNYSEESKAPDQETQNITTRLPQQQPMNNSPSSSHIPPQRISLSHANPSQTPASDIQSFLIGQATRLANREIDRAVNNLADRGVDYMLGTSAASHVPDIAWGYEEIYLRFINGKLIYKPNKDNNIGRIELPFSDLPNPLDGTFDLSNCGDIGRYLNINIGYQKEKKEENKNKVEVWIVPRFVIEKNQASSAKYLAPIMDEFTSPIGIFWTWGGWDQSDEKMSWYDYLTVQDFDELSNGENLFEKWQRGKGDALSLQVCYAPGSATSTGGERGRLSSMSSILISYN